MPTWVVTGASSGIGLELVKQLAARGEKVYATCRSLRSSMSGNDGISSVEGDVTVVEGIDVSLDNVGEALAKSVLAGVTIDVLMHNAGSLNGTRDVADGALFEEQKFNSISMDRMRAAFEVNTLGPLRVQQAFDKQMRSPGGKVAIISTGLASIEENGSGGMYAYRTSKAGVNMVAKNLSCDLKERGIAVQAIAPGFVVSEFAGGTEALTKMGGRPVDEACGSLIAIVDAMSMENSGAFMMVVGQQKGGVSKALPW